MTLLRSMFVAHAVCLMTAAVAAGQQPEPTPSASGVAKIDDAVSVVLCRNESAERPMEETVAVSISAHASTETVAHVLMINVSAPRTARVSARWTANGRVRSSEFPGREQAFLLTIDDVHDAINGTLVLQRDDFEPEPLQATVQVSHVKLSNSDAKKGQPWFIEHLSEGHSEKRQLDKSDHDTIVNLSSCSRGPSCSDSVKSSAYKLVSQLIGRRVDLELSGDRPASESEPMVLFAGIDGRSSIMLLDCRGASEPKKPKGGGAAAAAVPAPVRSCSDYADPWMISFERTKYFWAVYIEDDGTPYRTNIDVEFRRQADRVDYDELDSPTAALRAASSGPAAVRLGYKRFLMREAPSIAQVAFSREGSTYGLRQWRRVYEEYSRSPVGIAGGLMVALPAVRNEVSTTPIYEGASLQPAAAEVGTEEFRRLTFVYANVLWSHRRSRATDEAAGKRLYLSVWPPNVLLGMAVPKPGSSYAFFTGGAVPIYGDRISAAIGVLWIKDDQTLNPALRNGSRLPLGTPDSLLFTQHLSKRFSVGLAIDLAQWR